MLEQDVDTTLKVIVVGNGQVGKTSMITRFAKGIFTNEYKKTIGVDFLEKKLYLSSIGEEVTFLLWDTAGQEEYDAITRTYYKGAGACILAFSTTDRASFEAVESWYQKVTDECGNIAMVLVQNKVDLMDDAAMDAKEVEFLAKKLRLKLYRTCVKDDLNVSEVFTHLGSEFVRGGGQAALGVSGITSMEDVASKPMVDRNGSSSGGPGGTPAALGVSCMTSMEDVASKPMVDRNGSSSGGPGGTPAAKDGTPGSATPGSDGAAFKLGAGSKKPAVQRTGGKKSFLPANCCIL